MKTKAGAILSSIRIDRSQDRKISVQLYMGLREIILSGGLKGGERLPATRTLASEVGVSRTTALDAVSRLISEGLLESRIGAGTFVSHTMTGRVPVKPRVAGADVDRHPQLSPSMIRDRDAIMGYGNPFGLSRLRAAIATHLNASRGIQCDPDQIFVVGGAQQAFSLIGSMLLDRGGKVVRRVDGTYQPVSYHRQKLGIE